MIQDLQNKEYSNAIRNGGKGSVDRHSWDLVCQSCSLRTRNYMGQPQQLENRKDELSNSITTVQKDALVLTNEIKQIGMLDIKGNEQVRRIYSPDGVSPTLNSMQGGNRQPKIILRNRGLWKEKEDDNATCLDANYYKGIDNHVARTAILDNYKIRKLTPLECWRLMGFNDKDFYKAKEALNNKFYKGRDRSDSQLYKMAGNSIVVNVPEEIYKELLPQYMVVEKDIRTQDVVSQ